MRHARPCRRPVPRWLVIALVPILLVAVMWLAGRLPQPGTWGNAPATGRGTPQIAVVPCSQLPPGMRDQFC